MSRIFVVEDDGNIREIEEYILKNAGYDVKGYSCAADFYQDLRETLPDLILLDIMLPDEDGLTILGKLRMKKDTAKIPVIMTTAKSTELDKVRGLDQGADDYVTKPFGVMEFVSRVKALMRRAYPIGNEQTFVSGNISLDDAKRVVCVGEERCELTYKEYELLKLLLQKTGSIVTRDEIMREVWGADFVGESRTLDMHIKTLRKKLGEEGKEIHTIRNVGYMIPGR